MTERVHGPERLIIQRLAGPTGFDQGPEEIPEGLPWDLSVARRIAPGGFPMGQVTQFPGGELPVDAVDRIEKLTNLGRIILRIKWLRMLDGIVRVVLE